MAYAVDPAELLDVDVDHLARMLALVAAHRLGRLQGTDPIETEPLEDATDRRWRHSQLGSDLLAGEALSAERFDLFNNSLRRRLAQTVWPGASIPQPRQAFAAIPINPLANGPRADACGCRNGLRRLPARDLPYNSLSTERCQPGILVHVHPVLSSESEVSATSASSVRTGWTTYGKLTPRALSSEAHCFDIMTAKVSTALPTGQIMGYPGLSFGDKAHVAAK
jgi:hypothetical protein